MAAVFEWLLSVDSYGTLFRASLSNEDRLFVRVAQVCFLCSQFAGTLLYYAGASEWPTKFPASMSYTMSKGSPAYVMLSLWLCGWTLFSFVFYRNADLGTCIFMAQMFATGVIVYVFNKPGQNAASNAIHMIFSTLYIADHIVCFFLLNIAYAYRLVFCLAFAATALSMVCAQRTKRLAGLPPSYASSTSEWQAMLAAAGKQWRGRLWWSELAFMIAENMIFVSFVSGMASGLSPSGSSEPCFSTVRA
eukprot:TRINITY_DN26101_c0_g1_i1.p1 TRINITY_DN26101_c0_g1~~TRINITY_DN26101_c0_g1_i1.p1  ORF type:complete len:267 (+),score=19.65 TRINITY_DN26101_c0_g1_i1:59-802(+)